MLPTLKMTRFFEYFDFSPIDFLCILREAKFDIQNWSFSMVETSADGWNLGAIPDEVLKNTG